MDLIAASDMIKPGTEFCEFAEHMIEKFMSDLHYFKIRDIIIFALSNKRDD